jgi:co-chaperonin GroES (HSP10)
MAKAKIRPKKQIIVVGDRVLVQPEENKGKTHHGLYLPQGVEEKDKIQSGIVIKTGPGYPLPDPSAANDEPWSSTQQDAKYLPLQVEEGDQILFMRKSAVEVNYDNEKYLILPQSAILLIVRDDILSNLTEEEE